MSGNNDGASSDSPAGSLERFARRTRRRLSSTEQAPQQPGRSSRRPSPNPVDAFLRSSSSDLASSGEAARSRSTGTAPISRQPGPCTVTTGAGSSMLSGSTGPTGSIVWPAFTGDRGQSSNTNLPRGSQAAAGPMTSPPKVPGPHAEPARPAGPAVRGGRGPSSTASLPRGRRATGTVVPGLDPPTSLPRGTDAAAASSTATGRQTATGPPKGPSRGATAGTASGSSAVPSSAAGSSRAATTSIGPSGSGSRMIKLGVETEFYLAARNRSNSRDHVRDFADILAINYNAQVDRRHPRMWGMRKAQKEPENYTVWSVLLDNSILATASPWGLEMRSPILYIYHNSQWRNHVTETWRYLTRHYDCTANEECSTHIHVSFAPKFTLAELKQLASAVIQFEPAFEALMPEHRRGNAWAVSNFLGSPYLKRQNKTRSESIEAIEGATDEVAVFRLIQGYENSNFSWNFRSLFGKKGTIEFRQPPASLSVDDALGWAELALNFVQAAIQGRSSIRRFLSNVGGLRSFLEQVNVLGVNEPARLLGLFGNKPANAASEPIDIDPAIIRDMDDKDKLTEKRTAQALTRYRRRP